MGFFSNWKRRPAYVEPEIIGTVPCLEEGYSIVVRAKDGTMPALTDDGLRDVFMRHTIFALKTPSEAKTLEFLNRVDMPAGETYADGSVFLSYRPGGAGALDKLYEVMKGAGVIISREGLLDVVRADQAKYKDKLLKPVEPEGRRR